VRGGLIADHEEHMAVPGLLMPSTLRRECERCALKRTDDDDMEV
jgi:hypothetical protein